MSKFIILLEDEGWFEGTLVQHEAVGRKDATKEGPFIPKFNYEQDGVCRF